MKNIVFACLLVMGCGKTKIKECEALVVTAQKIEKCDKIPASNRQEISRGVSQIKEALKVLEDVGDQAPKDQLEMLAKTCQGQNDKIRELYEKVAPECLK
jgi:hypothetical protein